MHLIQYNQAIDNTILALSEGNYDSMRAYLEAANKEFDLHRDEIDDKSKFLLAIMNYEIADYFRALEIYYSIEERSNEMESFLGEVYFAIGCIESIFAYYDRMIQANPKQSEHAGQMIIKTLVEFGCYRDVDELEDQAKTLGDVEDGGDCPFVDLSCKL